MALAKTMTRHVCDPNGKGFKCDGGVGEVCCDSDKYPQDGFLSFDNFWRSAIIVLQTITVDGWNESAKVAADASGIVRVCPYFAILVFFGGFSGGADKSGGAAPSKKIEADAGARACVLHGRLDSTRGEAKGVRGSPARSSRGVAVDMPL